MLDFHSKEKKSYFKFWVDLQNKPVNLLKILSITLLLYKIDVGSKLNTKVDLLLFSLVKMYF